MFCPGDDINFSMSSESAGRSNSRSNLLSVIKEMEDRRNDLLQQHREVTQLLQNYTNQSMDLIARIEEVTSSIAMVTEELRLLDERDEETRRRNREELLRKRQELEEGRLKARQWFEERERRRRKN